MIQTLKINQNPGQKKLKNHQNLKQKLLNRLYPSKKAETKGNLQSPHVCQITKTDSVQPQRNKNRRKIFH